MNEFNDDMKYGMNCDDAWIAYMNDEYSEDVNEEENKLVDTNKIPKCSDIYISTKTIIAYLNKCIVLKENFSQKARQ